jgi:UDP-N-acetylmuramate dehydrogenase
VHIIDTRVLIFDEIISKNISWLKDMNLSEFLVSSNVFFEENVPLSKKTWIKTGGICKYWISPHSVLQLKEICKYLYANGIAFDLVGQTSNLFFHSTYNPQVVVSTVKVNNYEINNDIITCDCGVNVVKLAKDCVAQGYAGFYGLVGLPGTVASAAVNNAGCFNCSISSMLLSANVLLPDCTIQTIQKEEFQYSHRSSAFKRGEKKGIILSVKLKVAKAANIEEEFRKSEETKLYRKNKQEGPNRNLGSVFSMMKLRYNKKNRLASIVSNVMAKLRIADKKLLFKRILLCLYGYSDLNRYISDKQINTFVWRDAEAEQKFARYKEFMGKVFDDLTIEIEEKKMA